MQPNNFRKSGPSIDPARIPDLVEEKFKSIQGATLKSFHETIKKEVKISNALKALHDGSTPQTSSSPNRPAPNRTMASPDWDGEIPINFRQTFAIGGIPISDFESNNTLLSIKTDATLFETKTPTVPTWLALVQVLLPLRLEAAAPVGREPTLKVVSTTTGGLWVLNTGSEKCVLPHGELFGFNIGSWVEVASGRGVFCHGPASSSL